MKVLFCYDGPLMKNNNNYFGIALNDDLFKRYKIFSDQINMIIRIKYNNNELDAKYNLISEKGINIFEFSSKKLFNSFITLIREINDADLIIIRLPSIIGLVCGIISLIMKKKILVEVVGSTKNSYGEINHVIKYLSNFLEQLTKLIVSKADYVNYVTKNKLQLQYPTRGKKIGISNVVVYSKDFDTKIRIPKEKIIIGTIGAINISIKGQSTVIKAISRLNSEGTKKYYYELVGPGDSDELLKVVKEYKMEEYVTFKGTLKKSDLLNWLTDVHFYVQPSLTEGLPRSVIEAMSRSKLVIGTKVGGIPELIDEKYLFEPKKYEELVKIINQINTNDIILEGNKNYMKALNYEKSKLDNIREKYYIEIMESIRK